MVRQTPLRPAARISPSSTLCVSRDEVIMEDVATASAPFILAASTTASGGTSLPRSTTLNPDAFSIVATMSFPMVWTSPSTVQMTTVPLVRGGTPPRYGMTGAMISNPAVKTLADAMTSGRNALLRAYSSPTSAIPSVIPRSRAPRSDLLSAAADPARSSMSPMLRPATTRLARWAMSSVGILALQLLPQGHALRHDVRGQADGLLPAQPPLLRIP